MKTVRDILRTKGSEVWWCSPEAKVFDALALMEQKDVGALLVLEHAQIVGIVSERDYARKVILEGKSSKNTPVREIMTTKIFGVPPNRTLEECMALMTDKRVRHLPVLQDGDLVGIVSIGDVVKGVIEEKDFIIEQLENYITRVF